MVWSMGKDDEALDGPVVYGQLRPGAGELAAAQTLQPGIAYRAVLVQRSEGGGSSRRHASRPDPAAATIAAADSVVARACSVIQ